MNRRHLFVPALAAAAIILGVEAMADTPQPQQVASPPAGASAPFENAATPSVPVALQHPRAAPRQSGRTTVLPDEPSRIAALRRRYRDDPGFRQMIADFNAMQGHPDRGEAASLRVLDQLAVAGAPASALITAIQPRPAFLRALQRHWQSQHSSGGTDP